jgi:hypothetical protein
MLFEVVQQQSVAIPSSQNKQPLCPTQQQQQQQQQP